MKTAREIIAGAAKATPPTKRTRWANNELYISWDHGPTADAIIAALAAEGFSIVVTGRDPVTPIDELFSSQTPTEPEFWEAVKDRSSLYCVIDDDGNPVAALRPAREGKTG